MRAVVASAAPVRANFEARGASAASGAAASPPAIELTSACASAVRFNETPAPLDEDDEEEDDDDDDDDSDELSPPSGTRADDAGAIGTYDEDGAAGAAFAALSSARCADAERSHALQIIARSSW